jgi:hypothetical protein
MLHKEENKTYIVYPSWIQPTYSWGDLPYIIANPWEHNDFTTQTYTTDELRKLGYPEEIQPWELIDGPVGGGIILVYANSLGRWLPCSALTFDKGVDLSSPDSMLHVDFQSNVACLEPTSDLGWILATRKKPKYYPLGASAEHIESMSDLMFWLRGIRPGKKELKGLADVPAWCKHFGLDVERLDEPPQPVRDETSHWLDPHFQYIWFNVKGGGDGFGYHFAVMLYIGYHLAYAAGRRMRTIHLLSSIEGKPNPYSSHKIRFHP